MNICFAPMYVEGVGSVYIKCSGNKSAFFISSTESGSMKTFANGVAVKPTYDAVLNKLQIFLIIAFVFVGFVSSLLVLTDALSASSSISSKGALTHSSE